MTTVEKARKFYIEEQNFSEESLKDCSDEMIVRCYNELKESLNLYTNKTAETIKKVFSEYGAFEISTCMNSVIRCTTPIENGMAYQLRECYRRNGAKADINYRLDVMKWDCLGKATYSGIGLASVKIPFNASEKVILNRYKKIQEMLKQGK